MARPQGFISGADWVDTTHRWQFVDEPSDETVHLFALPNGNWSIVPIYKSWPGNSGIFDTYENAAAFMQLLCANSECLLHIDIPTKEQALNRLAQMQSSRDLS